MNAVFALFLLIGQLLAGLLSALFAGVQRGLYVLLGAAFGALGYATGWFWCGLALLARVAGLAAIRRRLISAPLLTRFRRVLPPMSATERAALESGGVGWERDLFSGTPDWGKLHAMPPATLSEEEAAFIDGPCEALCNRLDEWKITHEWADLPLDVWETLRRDGFFAMIIPKRYGGLEFSNYGHAQVLLKIASRSPTAAATVAVPNSLGPAELILHYGTDAQREYYLPRLADGREVPCFALTSPSAGSDATSIRDTGVICKGRWEGREVIGIRLNWDKRYITLAPVATLLGLAFKLYDPEHLVGDRDEYGITCALIPTNLPGIAIGRRHLPLNVPFQNGPTQGKDVFVPLEGIIGGIKMAGHGWRMLVENLSVGRSISLPTNATGGAIRALHATGVYARIRKQFRVAIAEFEGIQEPLARMAADVYTMEATRRMTLAALDQGERPAVAAAIVKYQVTEFGRRVANDAMDIHGGKGIILGPSNYLARGWQAVPIAITVEGANILTRSLMIFGQGAIRAHPFIWEEMKAAEANDPVAFDRAFFGHVGLLLRNAARAGLAALSNGRLGTRVPADSALTVRYRRLSRYSSTFALLADMSMLSLGGALKRRERLSARLGDLLSCLYMGSAVLKRYAEEGECVEDLAVAEYALDDLERRLDSGIDEILANLPNRLLARLLRSLVLPYGKRSTPASDILGSRVAAAVTHPSATRERLVDGIHRGTRDDLTARMDEALELAIWAEPLERRIGKALKAGKFSLRPGDGEAEPVAPAVAAGLISAAEGKRLAHYYSLVQRFVAVDDFTTEEMAVNPPAENETRRMAAWREAERRVHAA